VSEGETKLCPRCGNQQYVIERKEYPATRDPRFKATHVRLACGHAIVYEPFSPPWCGRKVV